ncbi:MAG: hypothetical protein AB2556_24605 [Candidatus Thiodiazotropha sp.]
MIISLKTQKDVWLLESRDQACSVIGKFTQGRKADGKRLTSRLVTDQRELDYLVRDTRLSGTLVGAQMKCSWVTSSLTTMVPSPSSST